jgi:hypothetical protein
MERAEFIFQIFFDQMELIEHVDSEFIITFRLFQLSSIEIFNNNSRPGTVVINEGRRMVLKMPQAGVIDGCPLEICIRQPRQGHTTARIAQNQTKLGIQFEKALQNPNRYVQKKYETEIKGKRDQIFGIISFTVSVCYTSSSVREYEGPPLTMTASVVANEQKASGSKKKLASRAVRTTSRKRDPLIPVIPETRTRSIFYFDKNDLLEENKALVEEITRLTELVQRLRDVVDQYEEPKAQTRAARAQKQAKKSQTARSEYIYRPPGLKKRTTTTHRY